MEKLIKLLLCASAIINLLFAALVGAHYAPSTHLASTSATAGERAGASTQINEISPEIVNELRDFLGLIPDATIDAIVAKHYIVDGEFRRAFAFLRGAEFTQLLLAAQQVPEVIEILDFLHLNVANATHARPPASTTNGAPAPTDAEADSETAPWTGYVVWRPAVEKGIRTDFVLLEVGGDARNRVEARRRKIFQRNLRTFSTFVAELLEHLPRAAYTQMINEKCQRCVAFARFYAALRSEQLRPLVDATLKSANLSAIIRTLSSHDVDAKSLVPIAFQVISWGPTPTVADVANKYANTTTAPNLR